MNREQKPKYYKKLNGDGETIEEYLPHNEKVTPLEPAPEDEGTIFYTDAQTAREFLSRQDADFQAKVEAAKKEYRAHKEDVEESARAILSAFTEWEHETEDADTVHARTETARPIINAILSYEYTDPQDLPPAYGESIPPGILEMIKEHIRLYVQLLPITAYIRTALRKDVEYKAQREAYETITNFFMDDTSAERSEFLSLVTPGKLRAAAKQCKIARRDEWSAHYTRLADEWEKDLDADRDDLFRELIPNEIAYLYRICKATGDIYPAAPAPLELSYIDKGRDLQVGKDKISASIFGVLERMNPDGQMTMFRTDKDKDGNQLYAFATLAETAGVNISRPLRGRDEWYLAAAGALYNEGQTIFSKYQLYKRLFGKNPSEKQMEKFTESIELMMRTQVTIQNDIIWTENNTNYIGDAKTDNPKYPNNRRKTYRYKGMLLPCKIVEAIDPHTGKVIQDAIQMYDEPPTLAYAKTRKEFITISPELLRVPSLKFTDTTATLHKYLLSIISSLKREAALPSNALYHPHTSPKVLKTTLYEKCELTTKSEKRNLRRNNVVEKILNHYQASGYIKGWREYDDCYTISV